MKHKKKYTPEEFEGLLSVIISQLRSKGLKATSMDAVANSLHMSKRTLYEIFGSKENMFMKANDYYLKKNGEAIKKIFDSSPNIMEAILKCFLYNRDSMNGINLEFLRDINQYFSKVLKRNDVNMGEVRKHHCHNLYDVLKRGVNEGYFREDLNMSVQCKVFFIQMESLKRMEEIFPSDITLLEVYDNIIIGFLRAISTTKGLEELERILPLPSAKYLNY